MKTEKFFIAKIAFKARRVNDVDTEIYIGTRSFSAGALYTDSPAIYGVLVGISGLGQRMGETLPDDRYGSLEINITRGSIGSDKNLSDFLDKYSVADQPVILYVFEKKADIEGFNPSADSFKTEFSGFSSDVIIDVQSNIMVLNVKSENLSTETPLFEVLESEFPNTLEGNIGRKLPLVFGTGETQAILKEQLAGASDDTEFLITTKVPLTNFVEGPIGNDFHFAKEGETYIEINLPDGSGAFPVFAPDDPLGADFSLADPRAQSFIGKTSSLEDSYLISKLAAWLIYAIQGSSQDSNATFNKEIYKENVDSEQLESTPIRTARNSTEGELPTTGNPAYSGGTYRDETYFGTPLPLDSSRYYAAVKISDSEKPSDYTWRAHSGDGTTSDGYYKLEDPADGANDWVRESSSVNQLYAILYACARSSLGASVSDEYYELTIHSATKNGFSGPPRIYKVGSDDIVLAGEQLYCILDNIDMIIVSEGLIDSAGYTGTAGTLLRADNIIKFLMALSNHFRGLSIPVDSEDLVNTTDFSVSTYCGNMSGVWQSGSIRNTIVAILDNSASRLAPKRDGSWRMWSHGINDPITMILSESDCILRDIKINGSDDIVNKISIQYDKKEVQGVYAQTLLSSDLESIEFYGTKRLSEDVQTLDYIRDPEQAAKWTDYKLQRFAWERMIITLEIPYWKNSYRLAELLDKIAISHPNLPSEYGGRNADLERPMTTDGEDLGVDFNLGDLWRKAKALPMRIVGRNPEFSINEADSKLVLELEVLENGSN